MFTGFNVCGIKGKKTDYLSSISLIHAKSKKKKKRPCAYKRNFEERSRNHCYRGKEMSIKYSEYVFVALVVWNAKCTRHIVSCGLSGMQRARAILSSVACPACNAHAPYCHLWLVRLYHIFPHYCINSTIFLGEKSY